MSSLATACTRAHTPAASTAPDARPLSPAQEMAQGLLRQPARIAPKFFYDDQGAALFDAITQLPEYYLTRTERAVAQAHGPAIAEAIGPVATVVEPGAGNCEKALWLCQRLRPRCFVGVDIAAAHLEAGVARLQAALPGLQACAVAGDITAGLALDAEVPGPRLVFYPGSSIGNFDPHEALALLQSLRRLGEGLLIGIDLPKAVAPLEAAYDDKAGVTAAFNRNVLSHVNRVLGSDFVPAQWQHRAFFNAQASRIEMHLEALAPQQVHWPGGARAFARGERIHTENSYKYPLPVFTALLGQAGYRHHQAWTDERGWYALVYARA